MLRSHTKMPLTQIPDRTLRGSAGSYSEVGLCRLAAVVVAIGNGGIIQNTTPMLLSLFLRLSTADVRLEEGCEDRL